MVVVAAVAGYWWWYGSLGVGCVTGGVVVVLVVVKIFAFVRFVWPVCSVIKIDVATVFKTHVVFLLDISHTHNQIS